MLDLKGRLACLMGRHEPIRDKVRNEKNSREGVIWIGACRRCGASIAKRNGHAWKEREPS